VKRIWLLRHAKSDWKNTGVVDHERPLNKRGRHSAAEVAKTVGREQIRPDLVLVSTARRAAETAEALELVLTEDSSLYNASDKALLDRISQLPDDVMSVLLIGHNPGMEDLAGRFGDADGMSTATLLAFDVEADSWADVRDASAKPAGRWEHPGR
jgi:phosphohistidine phosphatase